MIVQRRSAPGATNTESAQAEGLSRAHLSLNSTTLHNPRRIAQSDNSPLGVRPCARCGSRTNWRQIPALGNGWLCCPSRELLAVHGAALAHTCTAGCLPERRAS